MADIDLPSMIKEVIKGPHGIVNRLNTSRVPLCLPPEAKVPNLYTMGLSRYAEIYLGLEEVWHVQIGHPAEWVETISDDPNSYGNDTERRSAVLRLVFIPELLRTKRLEADLAALESLDPSIANLKAGRGNAGSEFRRYINDHIPRKPHILVVYVWIMYQALFNGGHFIRAQLLKAGPQFWGLRPEEMTTATLPAPLSFWYVEESEIVKAEFRKRVTKAGKLLTENERQDILDEALEIFRRCELITLELDQDVSTSELPSK